MSIWIKRLAILIAVLAVIGGFAYAFRTQPIGVDAGVVRLAPMKVSILQEGRTRIRNIYEISAPIAGHLARTILEEGDPVLADKTVIAAIHPLDPPLLDSRTRAELVAGRAAAAANLSIAKVELARAKTNLGLAEKGLERATRLATTGIIAESTLEKASGEYSVQKAVVEAAQSAIRLRQAELASAEASLLEPEVDSPDRAKACCVNLTAPISGVVLKMFAKSEQPVTVGAKIAEIGDPANLEIVVDLLSSDAVRIAPDTAAEIVNWGGDTPLAAKVRRIEPTGYTKVSALGIEEQRVDAVLELDGSDQRLGHGYRVYADIAVWQSPSVLQVPISALFRNGNDWNVFVVDGSVVHQVKIEIDHINDRMAEVVSGLAESQNVVLHPGDTLSDGSLVEIRTQ